MQIKSNFEFLMKIMIIGDSGVGKTNFLFKFVEGKFCEVHVATVGFDNKSKIIKLPSSKKKIKLQVWDTAGQERYMSINKNLFQKVQGIILMYDLTQRDSFENLPNWMSLIKQTVSNKTIILVGNKLDIEEDDRIVTFEEGKKFAKENNIDFMEVSGNTGENVEKVFTTIGEKIYENMRKEDITKQSFNLDMESVRTMNVKKDKKRKCCKSE